MDSLNSAGFSPLESIFPKDYLEVSGFWLIFAINKKKLIWEHINIKRKYPERTAKG